VKPFGTWAAELFAWLACLAAEGQRVGRLRADALVRPWFMPSTGDTQFGDRRARRGLTAGGLGRLRGRVDVGGRDSRVRRGPRALGNHVPAKPEVAAMGISHAVDALALRDRAMACSRTRVQFAVAPPF